MMGEVSAQGNLFGGDCQHLDYVGRTTFYGWLATEGPRVYPDEDFRSFYVLDNGRKSVPPSRMMRMVLLQWYDKVSDDEAIERAKYDLRWKAALGVEDHEGLCAKFTLQTFRGKLLLNERGRAILSRSVKTCRAAGAYAGAFVAGIDGFVLRIALRLGAGRARSDAASRTVGGPGHRGSRQRADAYQTRGRQRPDHLGARPGDASWTQV